MTLKDINIEKLLQLTSVYVDDITCIECCKYYTVPSTAVCGHSLCHSCWRARRTCPYCGYNIDKRTLMLNLPLQSHKENVTNFIKALEEVFNITFDYLINLPVEEGSNKNVKAWLTNYENHFSAPVTEYQESIPSPQDSSCLIDRVQSVEQVTSNIQIHSEKKKITTPKNIIHVPPQQDDWDKIEEMPEIERNGNKLKENCESSLSSFGFLNDENLFPSSNLRTSQRKVNYNDNNEVSHEKDTKKNSTTASNTNSHSQNNPNKNTKNWNNVKRMKKEFSKLNKKNRNKLNISIEKYKKTQSDKQISKLNEIKNNVIHNEHSKLDLKSKNPVETEVEDENAEVPLTPEKVFNKTLPTYSRELTIPNKTIKNISDRHEISEKENVISNEPNENQLNNKNNSKDMGQPNVNFFRKGPLTRCNYTSVMTNEAYSNQNETSKIMSNNNDDIEITIKIGTTLTNICIKKKENDVQLKINSDREIQTSLNNFNIEKNSTSCIIDLHNNIPDSNKNTVQNKDDIKVTSTMPQIIEKSTPSKKNTASADTTTVQYEITESIEKELVNTQNAQFDSDPVHTQPASQLLSKPKSSKSNTSLKNKSQHKSKNPECIAEDVESLNIFDIFDGESVKEGNVQTLEGTKNTPSAILMPSIKTNTSKLQKNKRERDSTGIEDIPCSKKTKLQEGKENDHNDLKTIIESKSQKNKVIEGVAVMESDSESMNYDALISKVFANIDADMEQITSTQKMVTSEKNKTDSLKNIRTINKRDAINDKCSENIFSISKGSQDSEIFTTTNFKTFDENTKAQIKKADEELETTKKLNKLNKENNQLSSEVSDMEVIEISTPVHDDDSDKSVVEDTPQKNQSFTRSKNTNYIQNTQQLTTKVSTSVSRNAIDKDGSKIVSLSDTIEESSKHSENTTVVETNRPTLDTPLTISKFVGQIKHKSTPVARKSLNFNSMKDDNVENQEQTLGGNSFVAAKTTQEKEFLSKAFDQTLCSPSQRPSRKRAVKLCVAGSCLTGPEQARLKLLCSQRNWAYVEKYSNEVTHLVVGVDENNKSQRSVKYMCALAGSKWIVSPAWVERCLQTKSIVDEEPFEALDGPTGEPGPRRSRIAKQKIFQGITFYCMPPFKILDIDTLKDILRNAGGLVVEDPEGVQVGRGTTRPALLLAEPENTQEDRFVYLAINLKVVPVNYEWVLNSLGSYTLDSIQELLLCPATLLPKATEKWPSELMSPDFD